MQPASVLAGRKQRYTLRNRTGHAVRGDQAVLQIGSHLLGSNGWQIEREQVSPLAVVGEFGLDVVEAGGRHLADFQATLRLKILKVWLVPRG